MQIVLGPVLTRKGGYAFDCWTPEEGLSRGYTYGRIDAHHDVEHRREDKTGCHAAVPVEFQSAPVLLQQGTNQSYGAKAYAEKIEHYLKENLFVKSLHPKTYENNPNFLGMAENLGLKFKAHTSFTKADIGERQALIQSICEVIWGQGA